MAADIWWHLQMINEVTGAHSTFCAYKITTINGPKRVISAKQLLQCSTGPVALYTVHESAIASYQIMYSAET